MNVASKKKKSDPLVNVCSDLIDCLNNINSSVYLPAPFPSSTCSPCAFLNMSDCSSIGTIYSIAPACCVQEIQLLFANWGNITL